MSSEEIQDTLTESEFDAINEYSPSEDEDEHLVSEINRVCNQVDHVVDGAEEVLFSVTRGIGLIGSLWNLLKSVLRIRLW